MRHVKIIWVDSRSWPSVNKKGDAEWVPLDEAIRMVNSLNLKKPMEITGFVIQENEDYLSVVLAHDGDNTVTIPFVIPKLAIKELIEIP